MSMRKALVVGINEYAQCPLHGCCNDADAIAALLESNEDGNPNFQVKTFHNTATKGALRSLIEQCFSGNTDVALFYYSGHGLIDGVGGYLVTPDYSKGDPGVSLQEILTIVNKSKCKEKVVILDSCFSGFMGNLPICEQQTSIIGEGVTILTASRDSETAVESDGHGLFTSLLLDALRGGAADVTGNVTPGGIYAYIDKALGPWDQRPVFKTNVTQFTSLRNVIPQVDVSVIHRLCSYFPDANDKFQMNPSFEPTNSPEVQHRIVKPYADEAKVGIFSDLQALESVGLVVPVGAKHMYFAAMESKSCALTTVGKHYWRLVKNHRI